MPAIRTVLTWALALSAATAWAGDAEVSFLRPEGFADAGRGRDAAQVQATLSAHLAGLAARYLPAGQTLKVEFTDIDLAGELRPLARSGQELRVLRGRADWPRLNLHYTLIEDGKQIASGGERLTAMDYLQRRLSSHDSGALPHEQRLLSEWFAQRFSSQR